MSELESAPTVVPPGSTPVHAAEVPAERLLPVPRGTLGMQLWSSLLDVVHGGSYVVDGGGVGGGKPGAVAVKAPSPGSVGVSGGHEGARDGSVGVAEGRVSGDYAEIRRDRHGDQVNAEVHSQGAGVSAHEIDYSRSETRTTTKDAGQGESQSSTRKLAVDDKKNVKWSAGRQRSETDAAGTQRSHGADVGVAVGPDGVSAGGSLRKTTKTLDGASRDTSGRASVDVLNGKASGAYTMTEVDAKGEPKRSFQIAGSSQEKEGLSAQEGSVGGGKHGLSLNLSGGRTLRAEPPVEIAEGQWMVKYSEVRKVGGGVGAEKGPVGASGSVAYEDVKAGTRLFKSEAEAKRFVHGIKDGLPDEPDLKSAAGALEIPVGESRLTGRVLSTGIGVEGNVGFAGVDAKAEAAKDRMTNVTRLSQDVVQVTLMDGSSVGGAVGAKASVVAGVELGTQSKDLKQSVVRFDLSDPAGAAAYDKFLATGKTPGPGKGVNVVQTMASTTDTDSEEWKVAGAKASEENRTTDTVIMDASGKLEVKSGTRATAMSIPWLMNHSQETSFVATERNDRERNYSIESELQTDSGDASYHGLAALTGVNAGDRANLYREMKSSGKWTVTTHVTEEQVEAFMKKVEGGAEMQSDWRDGGSDVDTLRRQYDNFQARLADATTPDERSRIMADFMAHTGGQGIAIMRKMTDFGPDVDGQKRRPDYDLALAGDENFRGPEFRAENERLLESLTAVMSVPGVDAGRIASAASEQLLKLRTRRRAIRDPKRYSDLPDQVRGEEVLKTDGYIRAFETLKNDAFSRLESDFAQRPGGGRGEGPRTGEREFLELQHEGMKTSEDRTQGIAAASEAASTSARNAEWAHEGAHSLAHNSAREEYDGPDDTEDYSLANGYHARAEAARAIADGQDRQIDAARIAFYRNAEQPGLAASYGELMAQLVEAKQRRLRDAASLDRQATGRLATIARRHKGDGGKRLAGMHTPRARGLE